MARFVDRMAPHAEWRRMHLVADRAYPYVYNVAIKALSSIPIDMAKLREGLQNFDIGVIESSIDYGHIERVFESKVIPRLKKVHVKAFDLTQRSLKTVLRSKAEGGQFDRTNPFAEAWARDKSSELITGITDETRMAIRDVIKMGFRDQIEVRQMARMIRGMVGLTRRQAGTVLNLKRELEERGLTQSHIASRLRKAEKRFIAARAMSIARTETLSASNHGQLDAWRSHGDSISALMEKSFIVTPDDRLCPVCEPLDDERVPINASFSFGAESPPVHPMCRCAMGLVRRQQQQQIPVESNWPIDDDTPRALTDRFERTIIDHYDSYIDSLSAKDTDVVTSYTGDWYRPMNTYLRDGDRTAMGLSEITDDHIASLQRTLLNAPDPADDLLVWRHSHWSADTKPGSIVRLDGFQSTTIDPNLNFSKKPDVVMLEIKPSSGMFVKDVSVFPEESEFLLPHGRNYEVIGERTVKMLGKDNKVSAKRVIQLRQLD